MRVLVFVIALSLALAPAAQAGPIIQPVAASTTESEGRSMYWLDFPNTLGAPTEAINQSGLYEAFEPTPDIVEPVASSYSSGITDFDSYVTSTLHSSLTSGGAWVSLPPITTGYFDLYLGAGLNVSSLALWTVLGGVQDFNLYARDNPDPNLDFTTFLGSFTATQFHSFGHNFGQVFTFDPTTAWYLRLEILSNYDGADFTAIGELAVELADQPVPVPEPASVFLLGAGAAGLILKRRVRIRPRASRSRRVAATRG
jgi:hypothetical protein